MKVPSWTWLKKDLYDIQAKIDVFVDLIKKL